LIDEKKFKIDETWEFTGYLQFIEFSKGQQSKFIGNVSVFASKLYYEGELIINDDKIF